MATDTSSGMRRPPKKRLARAKVKQPTTVQDDKQQRRKSASTDTAAAGKTTAAGASKTTKARVAAENAYVSEAVRKQEAKDKAKKIGIAVFAVVIALSMMLPSLVTIVSNMHKEESVPAQATSSADDATSADDASSAEDTTSSADSSSATDDASSTEETTETSSTITSIDEDYQVEVSALEKRLEKDPNNLAALLNLGKQYMSWGYTVSYYSSSDESATDHATELFDQAIDYYDRYLALNDSNAVKVDRALCQFYAGDYTSAQTALEQLTTDVPDYGPAWANLGLVYESMWNTESAQEAYKKAAETDPNDEYGAKSFANRRLAALNESAVTEGQDVIEPSTPTEGLSQTLNDAAGIGF